MEDSGLKGSHKFFIENQPLPMQRKSYSYENRYVLPNPIVVRVKSKYSKNYVFGGTVTVSLVDVMGTEVIDPKNRQVIQTRESNPQQILHGFVSFSIKVFRSAKLAFRFKFVIFYKCLNEQGNMVEEGVEEIFSSNFIMRDNKAITKNLRRTCEADNISGQVTQSPTSDHLNTDL